MQTQKRKRKTAQNHAVVQRLESANEFIAEIAHRGRRFFEYVHDTDNPAVVRCEVAKFLRDDNGKLWFWNEWRCKWIYVSKYGSWKGFHHGGTLHSLVAQLITWIKGGQQLNAAFFTARHWGYSEDEIGEIIEDGRQRGIVL